MVVLLRISIKFEFNPARYWKLRKKQHKNCVFGYLYPSGRKE
jgi:hypothetical protein